MRRSVPWLLVAALLVAACTADAPSEDDDAVADEPAGDPEPGDDPADEVAADDEPCRVDGLEDDPVVRLAGDDPVALSTEVAVRTHRCATVAVVAPTGGWEAMLAVPVAHAADAPLLLVDPASPATIATTLDDLAVEEVVSVGIPLDGLDRPGTELVVAASAGREDGATEDDATDETTDETIEDDATEDGATDDDATDDDATEDGATEDDATEDGATDDDATDDDATDDATTEEAAPDLPADVGDAMADARLALLVAEHLDVERFLAVPHADAPARLAAAHRTDGTVALLPVPVEQVALAELAGSLPTSAELTVLASDDADGLADALAGAGVGAATDGEELWSSTAAPTGWLTDPTQAGAAAVAAVAAAGRDEALLPIDATDLRAGDGARQLRELAPDRLVLVGEVTEDADWQLETVLTGPTLPGGGHRLFENERMVAIYGHPTTPALGVLGEQDLDGAVDRVREVAAPYSADGAEILPTFEIITTIASAEPGARDDYSRRTDPEVLRPWIDRAAEEGFYVVLDLQPGRTDFLEQAQEYEELLLEPHVGLALDPEWRLEPDQVHLRQIGSVQAQEVQRVADWLAALTREHLLPQKALVLHQFRLSMLPDRDTIVAPPELAVVVHMDGQGAIGDKYATYELITTGAEDRWVWGWKNFYDEDLPTPTPDEVLALDPLPWFVSYQ
jgi:hypothetical protein